MIILVGASASGKTEVAKLLNKLYRLRKVVTHTTRKMRSNEKQDIDYHFVSEKEFLKLKEKGSFVETTFYNGNYYGSSKKEIADDKVLIVDPCGLESFLALKNPRIVTYFLSANAHTRFNRMLIRGDDVELAKSRIENDGVKFTNDLVTKVNYTIDSENTSLLDMAKKIYELYIKHLESLE